MRLGALIAQAEGAAALARRAQRAADKQLNPKGSRRLRAGALAAASRVYARGAALAVATEGVRWVAGADGDARRARAAPRPRRRSIAPRAGCSPTSGRSPRRSTGGCDRDRGPRRELTEMTDPLDNAAAIVGVGAIMPDAPDAAAFWRNVTSGRYSISEVDPERWDPALYYDPDPQGAREDVLEDRRLGPGVGVGSVRLEAPDPAEGGRGDGRRPQVGGRVHARWR